MKRISLLLCAFSLMLSSAHSVTTRSQAKVNQIWDYCINEDLELFEYWTKESKRINAHELTSLIRLCIQHRKHQCLEIFLKHPLAPSVLKWHNQFFNSKITPLFEALSYKHILQERCTCVRLLLEAGADVTVTAKYCKGTALHLAYLINCQTCIEKLIEYHADKTQKDAFGKIPENYLNIPLHLQDRLFKPINKN